MMKRIFSFSLIASILFFGVLLRVVVWYFSGQPVDSWSALWGIMSRDLGMSNTPLWLNGQPLVGCIGVYLEFIFLIFLKLNLFTNGLAELTFSGLFIFSSYTLGKELFGKTAGLISMALSAIAPYYIMASSMMPIANYQAILFLGNIIFLLTYRICYSQPKGKRLYLWLLLGFTSGLALWCNIIIIPYLLIAIIFLGISHPRLLFSRGFLLMIIFFFIGSLAFWMRDVQEIICNIQRISLDGGFFNRIANAVIYQIPSVLGFEPVNFLAVIIYISAILYSVHISKDGFRNISRVSLINTSKLEMFIFFCIVAMVIFARFGFYEMEDGNDFIILYPVFIFFVTKLLLDIKDKSRYIFAGLFSLFIISNVINISSLILEKRYSNLDKHQILGEIVSYLKSESIDYVYTDYVDLNILDIISNGEIEYSSCIDKKTRLVDIGKVKNPALVLHKGRAVDVIKGLKSLGLGCDYGVSGDMIVFHPFPNISDYCGREILPTIWKVVSNFNPEDTHKAWDRDLSSRWTTHKVQESGMCYELDLGKDELVDRIVMVFNPDRYDYPRAFKVEFSKDKKEWECITDVSSATMEFFHSGEYPFFEDCDIRFIPKWTRFIKITQTSSTHDKYWSIREFFVFGP